MALHLEQAGLKAATRQHSLCAGGGGSLAKLPGVQNQPTPHLVLAQIIVLFRLSAHFPFT